MVSSRRRAPRDRSGGAVGVLIIVQNLPVPLDRRVWLECQTLVRSGHAVSVVCPKGRGDPKRQTIDDIEIFKYRPYPPTQQKVGFLVEYLYSFVMTAWLSIKAWRLRRFDVIQACNPPDIFWPIALVARAVAGISFVFDQHDLCPELYQSRFPEGPAAPYWGIRALEWSTYRAAEHVIATNESYRAIAMQRGRKRPEEVTVVRTGPDPSLLSRGQPDPALRRGRRYLVCYLGVMGPQDGVDIVLRAAATIVHDMGRDDVSFTLIGSGDCFEELRALRDQLGLQEHVEFTGRAPDSLLFTLLSTADIGLSPDPKNPLNDVSTMNKTMEYMAFGLPVVAFELRETRVSAGDAGVYVQPNDVGLYAHAIVDLLDDEERRAAMGAFGRLRVEETLAWSHQQGHYLEVYRRVGKREPPVAAGIPAGDAASVPV